MNLATEGLNKSDYWIGLANLIDSWDEGEVFAGDLPWNNLWSVQLDREWPTKEVLHQFTLG